MSQLKDASKSGNYERTILYSCPDFDVVKCNWRRDSISSLHGHGISRCVLLVKEGRFENRLSTGFKEENLELEQGTSLTIPQGALHAIRCLSESGETLHIYAPSLQTDRRESNFTSRSCDTLHSLGDLSLKDEGISIAALEKILKLVSQYSISTTSPYFMNQLFAGVLPQTAMANDLITQTRATLATAIGSPVFTEIEKLVVRELGALIGWKDTVRDGICVPGGSASNFMALHCARHRKLPSSKKSGSGSSVFKVYISNEAHYSFLKAAVALGFGQDAIERVEVESNGRLSIRALRERILQNLQEGAIPLVVVATAGTTVLGAFDPIDKVAIVANEFDLWLHVDAAWGAPALFSKQGQSLVNGIDLADSVTFDAHKFFASNLTSSFFLTRQGQTLFEANDVDGGNYLFHEEGEVDRGRLSWQCGRGADAVSFWTLWKHLGTRKIGETLDKYFVLRDALCQWIEQEPRLKLIAKPEFLNVCVEIVPPQGRALDLNWSKYVRNKLIEENQAMINFSTDVEGNTFLRLILVHPFLTLQHVKDMLQWALQID